ncbi:MAG: nucleotidyltransferase domain-containing protein [Desulfitobacteriaceae bacterium]
MERSWETAIKKFAELLHEELTNNLISIRLYGSVARGNATTESDIDILVVVHEEDDMTKEKVWDIAVEVNLEYDVVISTIVMSQRHYSHPLFQTSSFAHAIAQEGIAL